MLRYVLLIASFALILAQRELIRPDPKACSIRLKYSHEQLNGHNYFYSWRHRPTSQHERDWLDGRNICRKHCQDLVSLETAEEYNMIKSAMEQDNVKYIWTSGRKCNFDGCNRTDLQPTMINGWFWSGSGAKIPATNVRTSSGFPDWSHTGGLNRPQPDNREQVDEGGEDEACIAFLNAFYEGENGVKWHDVNCFHVKPWVCEDSEELLNFARATSRFNIP